MLHTHATLPGARRVASGVYEGGYLGDAAQLVRLGKARPSDFLFFRGRVEWGFAAASKGRLNARRHRLICPPLRLHFVTPD